MRRYVGALGLAVCLIAGPAFGQPEVPSKQAEVLFRQGLDLADASKFEEARGKFTEAYARAARPSILFNLARSEQLSGHPLDAIRHFRLYAQDAKAPKLDEAKQRISELEQQTGRLDVRAAAGAEIRVDGEVLAARGPSPAVDVTPGKHRVEARAVDGAHSAEVIALAGQTIVADVAHHEIPPAAPVAEARVAPAARAAATSGESGGDGDGHARTIATLSLAGAGVVAAGVGVVFAIKAGGASDDASDLRATLGAGSAGSRCVGDASISCQSLADFRSTHDSAAHLRTGLWIAGGVLLAGAAATWLVWPAAAKSKPTAIQVRPWLGGIHAMARF